MEVESVRRAPAPWLRGSVANYYGFRERAAAPVRRREGPGSHVVIVISFGREWLIDGERHTSFAAGLHRQQVTTEHQSESYGMHIELAPPAAWSLFRVPLSTLSQRIVELEEVFGRPNLPERLYEAGGWEQRFGLLDRLLSARLAAATAPSDGVVWAWRRLVETHGLVRIGRLAEELGWSRKRIVTRFREQVGLPPKAVARLLRFERAQQLLDGQAPPDWARIAVEAGYYDQSHLINDFRAVTGRTPETFFQDGVSSAA